MCWLAAIRLLTTAISTGQRNTKADIGLYEDDLTEVPFDLSVGGMYDRNAHRFLLGLLVWLLSADWLSLFFYPMDLVMWYTSA